MDILLAANSGVPGLPLASAASGGELARVMLALRLVVSAGPPVLVFDEVDAGIGGQVAQTVGRALSRLTADHQVLVVTHLPQVAACADRQVSIVKHDDGSTTSVTAEPLEGGGADRRAFPHAFRIARQREAPAAMPLSFSRCPRAEALRAPANVPRQQVTGSTGPPVVAPPR